MHLGKIYIVEEGINPSTDYFVLPYLHTTNAPIVRCTWQQLPDPTDLMHATVIFVRYVPDNWRELVRQNRQHLSRLIYFMDDDLFDWSASKGLSWRYRYKLLRHATRHQAWLAAMRAEFLFSTAWLVNKYPLLQAQLALPQPVAAPQPSRRVFYHGSASHHEEILWLYPIIKAVLAQDPTITFEIIGDARVNKIYRNLPRVSVIHPMKWLSYQHFIATPGRHIGLAPSLNHPFNLARSNTKFFDITRAGAVGIYADTGPAKDTLEHRKQGMLVNMTPSAWIDAILQFARQDAMREDMLEQAQRLMQAMTASSTHSNTDPFNLSQPPSHSTPHDNKPFGVMSHVLANIPYLETFLGNPVIQSQLGKFWQPISAIVGWGHKKTALRARNYAKRNNLRYIALEDGFLRSVGLGKTDPPLALVRDDVGIYYNANAPCALEELAQQDLDSAQLMRSEQLIALWQTHRVSKYNHLREFTGDLPARYVLVVDQTLGDASVALGQADHTSFTRMVDAALANHPDCQILIKTHPEVMAGHKKGHLDRETYAHHDRIQILSANVHPVRLIAESTAVYTVTSQLGFEALLWDKPVFTFGMPFYTGWGLTTDQLPAPTRRAPITLAQLTHAALITYCTYLHPETHVRCEIEDVLCWLGAQRIQRARFPETVYAKGFSYNKRPSVRKFLEGSQVIFVEKYDRIPVGETIAVWGSQSVTRTDLKVIRLEDGFIRSVGLGADLIKPLSWVVDQTGIYYDATRPSDLEQLLLTYQPSPEILARAHNLRTRIVAAGISKYNLPGSRWRRPPQIKTVILVPGQVETDASLALGAPHIKRNIDLLKEVRDANPRAYILYKPHPDVVAKLRQRGSGEDRAEAYCNEIIIDGSIHELLNIVDEVHVMTSLTGFEALLRERKVVTYGLPFYAGWGLTEDKVQSARRSRTVTLDQLVAAVLIEYPRYRQHDVKGFSSPETALAQVVYRQQEKIAFKDIRAKTRRLFAMATSSQR